MFMSAKFDLEEQKLQKSFKRLIKFAKSIGLSQSWEEIYIVEDKAINRHFESNQISEIPNSALHEFKNYENYFNNDLLRQGYSWINLSLLGVLNDDLILTIEIPNYNNHLEFTHVNLSCSSLEI